MDAQRRFRMLKWRRRPKAVVCWGPCWKTRSGERIETGGVVPSGNAVRGARPTLWPREQNTLCWRAQCGVQKSRVDFLISNWREKEHSENTIEAAPVSRFLITGSLWGFTFSEHMKLWAVKRVILKDFSEISTIVWVKILITRGRKDTEEEKNSAFFCSTWKDILTEILPFSLWSAWTE